MTVISFSQCLLVEMRLTFNDIKEHVWKSVHGWKENLLSVGGKEILIKAVTQAIPTYVINIFQLTKGLCKELNAMISSSGFLCGEPALTKRNVVDIPFFCYGSSVETPSYALLWCGKARKVWGCTRFDGFFDRLRDMPVIEVLARLLDRVGKEDFASVCMISCALWENSNTTVNRGKHRDPTVWPLGKEISFRNFKFLSKLFVKWASLLVQLFKVSGSLLHQVMRLGCQW
ncbi:hypothetical protein Ddye_015418 [Dipteronia dyeriana]|uniref:Uncharacterized protein n=1 Tax=Dipteronia dyeriana TaxID=168575 RepID=A0AAD9U5V7_9ROSI|nr:hypothetical protein Ddye_015418 [Dipteronia dyeriana]